MKNITTNDICNEFMESYCLSLKHSTRAKYSCTLKNHFLNVFQGRLINTITESELISSIVNRQPQLSSKSKYDIITLLNQLFNFAYQKHYVNQMVKLAPPKVITHPISVFSDTEIDIIKAYICQHPTPHTLGILIALFTGIRVGELCALTWGDVDLNLKVILINKTMQRISSGNMQAKNKTQVIVDTPKTQRSIRAIPIPNCLVLILEKQKQKDDFYILTNSIKGIEPREVQRKYKDLLKKAGVTYKKFHVLRHTFASRANAHGMDTKTLSELLGHENESFTLKMYVHISFEHKRDKMNSMYTGEKLIIN